MPGRESAPQRIAAQHPHEQTLEQIGRALAKCGDVARDHGVEIWMEVHGEGTQLPVNAHQILSVANHPFVGACWNSNPTDVENGSVRNGFELLKPWIRSCHINNLDDRAFLGTNSSPCCVPSTSTATRLPRLLNRVANPCVS